MMIMGFAITAGVVGKLIDPYTPEVLLKVSASLSVLTSLITAICLWRLEKTGIASVPEEKKSSADFKQTFKEVWSEPKARTFTIFVFLSMLAYSAQDLILEPFAGAVLQMTPGETTQLSGLQHGAVLLGMLSVAVAGSGWARGRFGSVQSWMVGGCLVSGLAMGGLCLAGLHGAGWPLRANVWLLGVANGAFSIAAISTMMRLAREGTSGREGTRMGLWGAAQGIAFGLGGLVGTGATDLARHVIQQLDLAYASVFFFEMLLFVASAWWAVQVATPRARRASSNLSNASWASQGQQP
jgi:BCD family chlorophyll transporter-like MFS transporter